MNILRLLLCSLFLAGVNVHAQDTMDFDSLTEQLEETSIEITVKPPSKFMLFLRTFSVPILYVYKLYSVLRQKLKAKAVYLLNKRNKRI